MITLMNDARILVMVVRVMKLKNDRHSPEQMWKCLGWFAV